MNNQDDLVKLYEEELSYLRQSGNEFAQRHPKIASHLKMQGETVEDPHVSRLLEGVAYLNARIQNRLNDDFPELTDALLETLYPHYLRPIPSMSIVQLHPENDLDSCTTVKAKTVLESDPHNGHACKFSTVYPTSIAPIKLTTAHIEGLPLVTPGAEKIRNAESVLRLTFKGLTDGLSLSDINLGDCRLFLSGARHQSYQLYDWLLNKTVKVVLARHEDDPNPLFLNSDLLQAVGFNADEGMLPYPAHSSIGYRLLTEFFVFPEKFLFIDLIKLGQYLPADIGNEMSLYIYFNDSDTELERSVSSDSFSLGCTPVVNLFNHQAEPIHLSHETFDYPVTPDARQIDGVEVYSIDRVSTISQSGEITEYLPFYGLKHRQNSHSTTSGSPSTFWHARRRNTTNSKAEQSSEMSISLTDLNFNSSSPNEQTLDLNTTCFNADLPNQLPYGDRHFRLHMVDGDAPLSTIVFRTAPTKTVRPPLGNRARWRLLTHLNLNQLGLNRSECSVDTLQELLQLYDFQESPSTQAIISSIQALQTEVVSAPIRIDGRSVVCRGTQIKLELNERRLTGTSPFLLASVLERFFALYCSINSFTRLEAKYSSAEKPFKRWPPRSGQQQLI